MTVIAPEDFGIWYIDCMDKPDRYRGKVVEFTGMVMKSNKFPKNYFVPGRMAIDVYKRQEEGHENFKRSSGGTDRKSNKADW